jgi:outer membrane autotransporter protein
MNSYKTLIFLAFAICMGSASAQKKFDQNSYFELGYSTMAYSDTSANLKPTGIRGIYGQNTSQNLGWEGLLGLGMNEDTATFTRGTVGLKIGTVLGLYGKAYLKPSDSFEIFGRLGYANVSRDTTCAPIANCTAASAKDTGSSISYGAGVKFEVSKNISIIGDYMSYYNRDSISINATTFGVSYGF